MKQLDVEVSPPARVMNCLNNTHNLLFDLDPYDLWP